MTERRAIIDLDREATPDQMAILQDGIEDSIDHIVSDTLVADRGYSGMAVSFAGTVVTVGVGRLYVGGKVYAFDTPMEFDVQPRLPLATKKRLAVIAFGTEADTGIEQVNFLIEAESTPSAPVYKPQAAATEHVRLAVVQPAYGQEAPNPPDPDTGLALTVATLLLSPAGILSCTNVAANRVPNLGLVESRTRGLEAFRDRIDPAVSSLQSDLASLANSLKNSASQGLLARMLISIADLNAKVGIPANAADSASDYLLDPSKSDLAHPLSNCKVQEGFRFADDGASDAVLDLFNPFETAGVKKGGVLLPAYDRYLRRTTGPRTGALLASGYTYNPVAYTLKTMARSRVRWGNSFTVCSNAAFWSSGSYDPISGIFSLPNGDTFKAALDINGTLARQNAVGIAQTHLMVRLQQFWTDQVSESYWDATVQAPQTIAGYHLAETELIGQDQWIDAIGFTLTKLDSQGDVTVLCCEAGDNAAPNTKAVLAKTTMPYASLALGENVAALTTPVMIAAGKRVSYVLITTGAHELATTDGPNFPQGTFFVLAPSGYAQGDLTKHLCLNIYGCRFQQSVATIPLQNLQLAGGITAIDILAGTIVPPSTRLTYMVQITGGWVPLADVTPEQLNAGGALPPNLPLRVVFAGSPDMMPALDLAHSNAHCSRPRLALKHVWPKVPRTPPVSSNQIRAIVRYESFDAAFQTASAKLLTGSGYTTETAASSFTDKVTADGGLERIYVFNLVDTVTSYKIMNIGGTTSALKVFHGAWIKDYVL